MTCTDHVAFFSRITMHCGTIFQIVSIVISVAHSLDGYSTSVDCEKLDPLAVRQWELEVDWLRLHAKNSSTTWHVCSLPITGYSYVSTCSVW
jgi:hypothetical protein